MNTVRIFFHSYLVYVVGYECKSRCYKNLDNFDNYQGIVRVAKLPNKYQLQTRIFPVFTELSNRRKYIKASGCLQNLRKCEYLPNQALNINCLHTKVSADDTPN